MSKKVLLKTENGECGEGMKKGKRWASLISYIMNYTS